MSDKYCTVFDLMYNSKNKRAIAMAEHIRTLCMTSIVASRDSRVTVLIPPEKDIPKLDKETMRSHIIRRAYTLDELESMTSKITSNNAIDMYFENGKLHDYKKSKSVDVEGDDKSMQAHHPHKEDIVTGAVLFIAKPIDFEHDPSREHKDSKKKGKKKKGGYMAMGGGGGLFDHDDDPISMVHGPGLRSAILRNYAIRYPVDQYPLSEPYNYAAWCLSDLINYLDKPISNFHRRYRQFFSFNNPLSSLELLLQPRQMTDDNYLVSDTILRGFTKSPHWLSNDVDEMEKAKKYVMYGGRTMAGGFFGNLFGKRAYYNDYPALYEMLQKYRLRARMALDNHQGSTGDMLDVLYRSAYKPFYNNQVLYPDAVSVHKRIDGDVALAALHNDMVRLMAGTYSRLPNYNDIMDQYFASRAKKNYEALKRALDQEQLKPLTKGDLAKFIEGPLFLYMAILDTHDDDAILARSRARLDASKYNLGSIKDAPSELKANPEEVKRNIKQMESFNKDLQQMVHQAENAVSS